MDTQDYKSIRAQRRIKAFQLNEKPYSPDYICYFLSLILNCPITDIRSALDYEFVGDKVDRDYINDLLTDAEDLGLATEGVVIIAGEGGILVYNPPEPGERLRFEGIATSSIFHGGEGFNRRAQVVRSWCQDMVGVELQIAETDSLENLEQHDSPLQTEAGSSKSSASKKGRGGEEADRSPVLLDIEAGIPTSECDRIASTIHLCPPETPYEKQTDGHTRIWAFATALKEEDCAKGAMPQLAKLLGKRYGYIVGNKLTDKPNKTNFRPLVDKIRAEIKLK